MGDTCSNLVDDDCDGLTDTDDPNCLDCTQDQDCDDFNDCTEDLCVSSECSNPLVADGASCEDGFFCTVSDSCAGGACSGDLRDCSAYTDQCNAGMCDESNDTCAALPLADGISCNDDLFCTEPDSCTTFACAEVLSTLYRPVVPSIVPFTYA